MTPDTRSVANSSSAARSRSGSHRVNVTWVFRPYPVRVSLIPSTVDIAVRLDSTVEHTPTEFVRPCRRLCASALCWYPSSSAAASTFCRVAARTGYPSSDNTRDTVAIETAARVATSRMLTMPAP